MLVSIWWVAGAVTVTSIIVTCAMALMSSSSEASRCEECSHNLINKHF